MAITAQQDVGVPLVLIKPVLEEGSIHAPSQRFWDRLGALGKRWGWLLKCKPAGPLRSHVCRAALAGH